MRLVIVLVLILGSIAAGGWYYVTQVAVEPPANFRAANVKRGDLLSTIGATGTVEPEEVVDVGAQVQGRVLSLGTDMRRSTDEAGKRIDYGSVVEEGTTLALIDDAVYKAQRDQSHASLNRAEADLLQYKAKVEQTEAKVDQMEAEWSRAQRLRPDLVKPEEPDTAAAPSPPEPGTTAAPSPPEPAPEKPLRRTISDADFVLARANYRAALADHRAADANVALGDAAIEQAQAALQLAETNLSYTVIKSPVKGVIIDRRVNIGQTVVASLNAPSLFLIAKDLSRMQVWASVNEADIGRIRKAMPVRFTVDAYPGEIFRGTVVQIRLNATMTQNVVTYTVVVETDNADLRLLPYLTASLQFEVEEHKNVLLVPNAALRWKPRPAVMVAEVREKMAAEAAAKGGRGGGGPGGGPGRGGGGAEGRPGGKPTGENKPSAKPEKARDDRGRLWVKDGDLVRPVEVQIGATDGLNTEVIGDKVEDGTEIVLSEIRADRGGGDTTNPFAPKLFQGRPKQ